MPIHRVPGGRAGSVFAFTDELDKWLVGRAGSTDVDADPPAAALAATGSEAVQPRMRQRMTLLVAVPTTVLLALIAVAGWRPAMEPVTRVEVRDHALVALGAEGRVQWTHRPPDAARVEAPSGAWHALTDLDGDGSQDLVAALGTTTGSKQAPHDALYGFSSEGRLRWRWNPVERLRFRADEFGPPWMSTDVVAYRAGGEPLIAWVTHHYTWWPGILTVLDAQGKSRGRFVNAGWLHAVLPTADGRSLVVAGVNNAANAHVAAVVSATAPAGASPEPAGSAYECTGGCAPGGPLAYFLFPRTEIGRLELPAMAAPVLRAFSDGRMLVQTIEGEGPDAPFVVYELSPALALQRVSLSDSYWRAHARLQQEGRIGHAANRCPDRDRLRVRVWRPGAGWADVRPALEHANR